MGRMGWRPPGAARVVRASALTVAAATALQQQDVASEREALHAAYAAAAVLGCPARRRRTLRPFGHCSGGCGPSGGRAPTRRRCGA